MYENKKPYRKPSPPPRMFYLSVEAVDASTEEYFFEAHEYTVWVTKDGGRTWDDLTIEQTDEYGKVSEAILYEIFRLTKMGFVAYRGKTSPINKS